MVWTRKTSTSIIHWVQSDYPWAGVQNVDVQSLVFTKDLGYVIRWTSADKWMETSWSCLFTFTYITIYMTAVVFKQLYRIKLGSNRISKDNKSKFCFKGGVCIFSKMLKKTESGQVPKQTCSQSAVRGVSTHDVEESALSAHDGH